MVTDFINTDEFVKPLSDDHKAIVKAFYEAVLGGKDSVYKPVAYVFESIHGYIVHFYHVDDTNRETYKGLPLTFDFKDAKAITEIKNGERIRAFGGTLATDEIKLFRNIEELI